LRTKNPCLIEAFFRPCRDSTYCEPVYPALKRWAIYEFARIRRRRNGICVVRIGDRYRAIGLREGDVIAWFWIGTHEQYNRFHF
jgi:hypothetical protein